MRSAPLAKRYAGALVASASAHEKLNEVVAEIQAFADLLAQDITIAQMLYSPSLERSKKKLVIDRLCADRCSRLTHEFLLLLMRKRRLPLLPDIVREVENHRDKVLRCARVKVITAVPVSHATEDHIRAILERKLDAQARIECSVDPEILGGVVVTIDGRVVDASVRHQLSRLRTRLRGD